MSGGLLALWLSPSPAIEILNGDKQGSRMLSVPAPSFHSSLGSVITVRAMCTGFQRISTETFFFPQEA